MEREELIQALRALASNERAAGKSKKAKLIFSAAAQIERDSRSKES